MSPALPLHPGIRPHSEALRKAFRAPTPLTDFVVIRNFLRPDLVDVLVEDCRQASYASFCGYWAPGDPELRNELCEPEPERDYVTIHHRPTGSLPSLARLEDAFCRLDTVEAMSELTGIALSSTGHSGVLTCWEPWSFLGPHTDAGDPARPTRLVISLSLTRGWERRFGGRTVFAWEGSDRSVTLEPCLNSAVLFAPSLHTTHWVDQVTGEAPSRRRFTWTMAFR